MFRQKNPLNVTYTIFLKTPLIECFSLHHPKIVRIESFNKRVKGREKGLRLTFQGDLFGLKSFLMLPFMLIMFPK